MKKVILGFLAILFAGQISFAQPVSDMAVIPMGITIQNIMRLTITRGGNIEFVFSSAADRLAGLGGAAYTTAGTVVSTQAWDLELTTDAAQFDDESGTNNLPLATVELATTTASTGTAALANTALAQGAPGVLVVDAGAATDAGTFSIEWACGTTTPIPAATLAGRYTVNVILSLVAN